MVDWRLAVEAVKLLWQGFERWLTLISLVYLPIPPLARQFPQQSETIADWLPALPWWSAFMPLLLLFAYSFARADYRKHRQMEFELKGLQARLESVAATKPSFIFSLSCSEQETPYLSANPRLAYWYRIEVKNNSPVEARNCRIDLENVSPSAENFSPGPLIVNEGTLRCNISPGGSARFDLCFRYIRPDEWAFIRLPGEPRILYNKGPYLFTVTFTESQTPTPKVGTYLVSFRESGLAIDATEGLGSTRQPKAP